MSTRFQDGEILCAAPLNEFDDLLVALCNAATTAEVRTCLGMLTETELGEQYLRLDGTNRMTDQLQLEGTDPVEDWHAVTKKWVADQLALIGASQGYARHDETLVAHGFTVGQAIYWDGGQWQLAQADALSTTGTHVVAFVYDVDTVQVAQSGYLDGLAGLQGGEVYYVSDATPGALTTTAPAIENPLLLAIDETTGWVLNHKAEQQASSPIIDHPDTTNRDAADSHPISAVTGLQAALDATTVHNATTGRDAADAHPIDAITDLSDEPSVARAGRKNLLFNQAFDIWQRGTSFSLTTGNAYTADRWSVRNTSTGSGGTNTVSQITDSLGKHSLQMALAGLTDTTFFRQKVEHVRTASGKNVVFTVEFGSSTAPFYAEAVINQYFGTGGSPSALVENLSLEGEQLIPVEGGLFHWTINLSDVSAGTVGDSDDCLICMIYIGGVGATPPPNVTFSVRQTQLEIGATPTDFEHRSLGEEWALCLRYYWQGKAVGQGAGFYYGSSSVSMGPFREFQVRMRVAPTLSKDALGGYTSCSDSSTPFTVGAENFLHRLAPDRWPLIALTISPIMLTRSFKYGNCFGPIHYADNSQVEATFDTGLVQYIPYPCRGSGCQYLAPYEAHGGVVDPYDEPAKTPDYDVVAEIEALKVRVTALEDAMPGPPI